MRAGVYERISNWSLIVKESVKKAANINLIMSEDHVLNKYYFESRHIK